jgi:hypothetical protein
MRSFISHTLLFLFIFAGNAFGQSNKDADLLRDLHIDRANYITKMSTYLDTTFLNRYEEEVVLFEKEDSANGVFENQILFVGSSSIRKWYGLKKDMYPLQVLNRGFGGSTFPELLFGL